MTFPTIHLNGTSADELLEQVTDAIAAIGVASRALADATPHARDYYVQTNPETAYAAAREEHKTRLLQLSMLSQEMQAIAENICDQSHRLNKEVYR